MSLPINNRIFCLPGRIGHYDVEFAEDSEIESAQVTLNPLGVLDAALFTDLLNLRGVVFQLKVDEPAILHVPTSVQIRTIPQRLVLF